ncbi:PAS domain S-box-containing protein/diguanylate cyclase (GGDEF) domain-containing protein [Duganella sp. CF402]|uniref:EAL domain-containing protein n=1 Tax=unclassified Duganella TaxID=2636909 RepID=UPI0008ACDF01|nr:MULTISPECIES: EAL domain-containing protein [unclassified Duganella]RZT05462.1 PAS domain S-box-containing protein/diguanylate cyclase (GGDEF)-like protein [Duganella sp. BK701]SEN03184.1 PAS domain S-box-containing protein/diguanylate cyclase (GGDEF) domain-containing protein [Duganella sp. CF402]
MPVRLPVLAKLCAAAALLLVAVPGMALEKVTLQLKHAHQFQFAGYYAALELGYYKDAGLDVRILEGQDGNAPERDILAGRAQYGTGASNLLLARLAGKPVVVLAVVFQHSPYALAMRQTGGDPDLRRLIGKRAMIGSLTDELSNADELLAYLTKEGVPPASFTRVAHSFNPEDLISGKVDAMAIYTTNEPDTFDRLGFPYDIYSPRAVGIDFYGDNLFTSEQEIANHPARVRAFRAASLRGWQWAMSHHEEAADLILNKYSRRADRQHLLYEARQMVPLVQPVLVEIGYMNPDRWQHIADVYSSLGMLPKNAGFEGFMYRVDTGRANLTWLYRVLGVAALLLVLGAAIHFSLLARERKRALETIRKGEQRFRTMFEASPLGIALIDSISYEYRDINARYQEILGRSQHELRGLRWLDVGHPDDIVHIKAQMALLSTQQISNFKALSRLFRPDGSVAWIDVSVNAIDTEAGSHPHHLCMIEDVTAKKQSEQLIWQQANFDALTHLPNRRMFMDRLGHEILKSQRDKTRIAVLFIDLDHFKEVNDTLGHQQGDVLLVDAARRISACVRKSDTVARLGGDEFTVILCELEQAEDVERIAQDILRRLLQPFELGAEQAFVSASIGITLYPDDAIDIDSLLKHADQAMYAAKGAGRNRYSYFTPTLQVAALSRMRLTNDLRGALKGNQFELYFQPIVHLESGAIHKAEALIRWNHPQRGVVSPLEFIPLAESSGLIVEIGEWVFREAARWVQQWRQCCHPDFQVSLNQSPLEFQREGSSDDSWLQHLQALELPGQSLVVEITEGLLLDASNAVSNRLLQLRDAGIQVALDDFGTGYSSLSYLKKFDIDYLKIDRSFTRNLAPDSSDMALSEAIIVMAHKLELKVIAEGVETPEQRALLAAAGCDYGQGYLFAKPMPAAQFDAFLRDNAMPSAESIVKSN